MTIDEFPAPSPAAPPPGLWRFGDVVLDEQQASLHVAGIPVALDRSSHDVLLALLRHAGEVVTKEELLEAGWPGRLVSENSLAKAVSRLRQALGPQGAGIRAVHGYGYRLAAAVEFGATAREDAVPQSEADPFPGEGDEPAQRPGWRLVRRLGDGAASVAFLAEDGSGAQRVLKFARGETGLRGLKREVALSRHIGSLQAELPDVVRVLDWNLAQPPFFIDLPYFADGHLGAWASGPVGLAALDRAARIELCAQLCEAVAGLHEIGIIHRDLKPENLYPWRDAEGQLRLAVADLGAGQAATSLRLQGLDITLGAAAGQLEERAGSLRYVAPEVVAGGVATQRSDVYALGVLAYQVLVDDLLRPLAPGWEADLDDSLLCADIALAAAASPARRLSTASAFAARLRTLEARRAEQQAQREAEREQAQARRVLERQRARRPWLLATAAALALGVAASGWLYLQAVDAGRAAREQAAIADAVNRFFNQDVLAAASPYADGERGERTVREAIDHAVTRIDDRIGHQPVVEATVRLAIGRAYGEAMLIAQAIEQKRRAVALFEQHLGPRDPRTQRARYQLAVDLVDDSRFDEAAALIRKTDALRTARARPDLETALAAHQASCYWHIRRGEYEAGQPACENAVSAQLAFDDEDHTAVVKVRTNLAVLHSRAGRAAQAERQFSELAAAFAAQGDTASPTRLRILYLHGMNLLALGRHYDAGRALAEAHRGSAAALGADNPHTLEIQVGLGQLHMAAGRHAEAVPLLRQAHAAYARRLGADNHYTLDARQHLEAALCAADADAGATTAATCAGAPQAAPSGA